MLNTFHVKDEVEFNMLCGGCRKVDRVIRGYIDEFYTDENNVEKASVNTGDKYTGTNMDVKYSVKLEFLRYRKTAMDLILSKYAEFNEYLKGIDLIELSQSNNRKDLEEFVKQLYATKTRSLAYELLKVTEGMKQKEYPELMGVHHYPEIKGMEFLSDDEKVALDEYLLSFRVGNYIRKFYKVTSDDAKNIQINNFLISCGIIERKYYIVCNECETERLSTLIKQEVKDNLELVISEGDREKIAETLEKYLVIACEECGVELDLSMLTRLSYEEVYLLVKDRDTSLDNA